MGTGTSGARGGAPKPSASGGGRPMDREIRAMDEKIDNAKAIGRDRGTGTYATTIYEVDAGGRYKAEISKRGRDRYEALIVDKTTNYIVDDIRGSSLRSATGEAKGRLKSWEAEVIYQKYRGR